MTGVPIPEQSQRSNPHSTHHQRDLVVLMDNLTYFKGGAEVMVLNLCQQAALSGRKVTLVGPRVAGADSLLEYATQNHFALSLIPAVPALLAQPELRWAIPFGLNKRLLPKPAAFLINDPGPLAFMCLLRRPKQAKRLVYFMHTNTVAATHSLPLVGSWRLILNLLAHMTRWIVARSDITIVPSQQFAAELLAAGVPASKLCIIPTGLDPYFCQQPEQAEIDARRSSFHGTVILFVGRLSHEKNIPLLLQAFQSVLGQHYDTQLILAGDGPAAKPLERLCHQLGIRDRTHFIGRLNWVELRTMYWAADVFCMPSEVESQGLSLLEAQACARPCVAMNRMGSADAIEHNVDGLLVDVLPDKAATASGLADAINKLLDEPTLAFRLGQAARAKATSRTNKDSVSDLLKVLDA